MLTCFLTKSVHTNLSIHFLKKDATQPFIHVPRIQDKRSSPRHDHFDISALLNKLSITGKNYCKARRCENNQWRCQRRSGEVAAQLQHLHTVCGCVRKTEEPTAAFLQRQEDTGCGGELQDADLTDIQSLHSPTHKSLNSLRFCLRVVIYIYVNTEELLVELTSRFTYPLLSSRAQRDFESIAETIFFLTNNDLSYFLNFVL